VSRIASRGNRVLAAGFLVLLTCLPFASLAVGKPLEVGQKVPDFSLPGLEGGALSFEKDIRGKAPLTVFLFMTTACSACYDELKEISEFVGKNPGKVDAWAVAVDLRGEQTVGPYRKANFFRVKYLVDPKFSLPRAFGFNYTPSLAVVDARGVLLHKKGGYSPNERIADLLRTFLK